MDVVHRALFARPGFNQFILLSSVSPRTIHINSAQSHKSKPDSKLFLPGAKTFLFSDCIECSSSSFKLLSRISKI